MSDERIIRLILTQSGLRAVFNGRKTGVNFAISHIAVGASATGAGYIPTGGETALQAEFLRVPVAGGEYAGDFEIFVEALLTGAGEGWVHEMGLFGRAEGSNDPLTLLAIWSEQNAALVYKTNGVPIAVGGSVTWIAGAPRIGLIVAEPWIMICAEVMRAHRLGIQAEIARVTPIIQNLWW